MNKSVLPHKIVKGRKVINLENYFTYYFAAIANRLSRGASAMYREKFGVGVVEWRCMVMLALKDGVSAASISSVSGVNKSLVSRSLAKLEKLDYVEDCDKSTSRKPRFLKFTSSGKELYDQMLELTLQREKKLRKGLSAAEIKELLRMLKILFNNADELDQLDYHIELDTNDV
ncbi:MAG: MarR family transcriptional regulator [Gammaproteobacteria bacterium]|nr:MarR family transcriptional regulator [Gammaproteobacteria bacterium]